MSLNLITLVANLGKDPEVVTLKDDLKLTKFSVAVNTSRKEGGEWKKITTWYNIACFGALGTRFAENAVKGSQAYIVGVLKPREWTDSNGATRISFDVEDIKSLELLEKPAEKAQVVSAGVESSKSVPAEDLDLPF